jgi:predicted O-methyltransferase YrrM
MIRDPNTIPGWFLPIEADAIVHAALHAAGACGRLLEIGTWCGRSTSFFADALPGWDIHTVDPYPDHVVAIWGRELQAHPEDIAADNFRDRKNITAHCVDSLIAAQEWTAGRMINVLFLDGEHLEQRVRKEIAAWMPHLAPGAVVLFHDAVGKPDFSPAVQRAALAELRAWGHAPDFEAGSLWAFRRIDE